VIRIQLLRRNQQTDTRGPVTEDSRDKETERTEELKRTDPTLCDSSPDSGEEEEVNKEERTSDDAYFKQTMTEMGKK
jgi:hypothetical protein